MRWPRRVVVVEVSCILVPMIVMVCVCVVGKCMMLVVPVQRLVVKVSLVAVGRLVCLVVAGWFDADAGADLRQMSERRVVHCCVEA